MDVAPFVLDPIVWREALRVAVGDWHQADIVIGESRPCTHVSRFAERVLTPLRVAGVIPESRLTDGREPAGQTC